MGSKYGLPKAISGHQSYWLWGPRNYTGRTTIIVAHRISTIQNADEILVLQNGRITACGRHESLMRDSELYKALCSHQQLSASLLAMSGGKGDGKGDGRVRIR